MPVLGMWGPVHGRHTMGFHCIPESAEQFRNFCRDSEMDAFEQPAFLLSDPAKGGGLVAALAWGAAGIAMGTRFLLSAESTVPEDVKRRYLQAGINDTVVTSSVDGHPQRVIRTELVEHIYKQDFDRDSNTIEVFIGRIRKKIAPKIIKTVRGLGYQLNAE